MQRRLRCDQCRYETMIEKNRSVVLRALTPIEAGCTA